MRPSCARGSSLTRTAGPLTAHLEASLTPRSCACEVVLGKNNTEHSEKLDLDWSDELWVGRRATNDDLRLLLTSHGVMKTRSIRRKLVEQQSQTSL